MPYDLLSETKRARRETLDRMLALVADLNEEQLAWRPGPHAPSIGFHLWHTARWLDLDRAQLDGGPHLWHQQGLAQRWGIDEATLGGSGAGTGMGDDASERLVLPSKAELVAYAEAVFDAFCGGLERLTAADLNSTVASPIDPAHPSTIGEVLLGPLSHDNRHLGMIEALRGLLGLDGSATD